VIYYFAWIQVGAVFAKLDRNGNGTLDKMELIVGLRELKHPKPTCVEQPLRHFKLTIYIGFMSLPI